MPAPAAAWTIAVAETPSAQQGNVLGAARAPCEAMLDVCTRNDAHALNQVDEIGLRATGKCADIILIDRDVLMVPVTKGSHSRTGRRAISFPLPTNSGAQRRPS